MGLSVSCFSVQHRTFGSIMITVPDDYQSIQEAINNADGGDTVFVRKGAYYEHLVVNKNRVHCWRRQSYDDTGWQP
jgi:pectin methylesterase-like acyl-CoA thioesterase